MSTIYPMLIQPRFDERIWGGHALAEKLGKAAPPDRLIGESWEIYEENSILNGPYAGKTIGALRRIMGRELTGQVPPDQLFPLLTKLIDARDVLSVQVHPDNHFAQVLEGQPYGKTECWYVIDAVPGAELTFGFARVTGPDEYVKLVASGKLEEILRQLPVRAGDVVYIPAGTVHAIGAGIVVYEVQQTSDVTYRIYDWNRRDDHGKTRELHVDKARQVLDYHRASRGTVRPLRRPGSERSALVAGPYFCLELIEAHGAIELHTHDSPVAVCALERTVQAFAGVDSVLLARYSSLLIPAAAGTYSLEPASRDDVARALIAYVPRSQEAVRAELQECGFSSDEIDSFLSQFTSPGDLGSSALTQTS